MIKVTDGRRVRSIPEKELNKFIAAGWERVEKTEESVPKNNSEELE
jgi:hypothetical protein